MAEIWPTCAVCRRHMRFACQLTLGGKGTLLHAMYAVENTGEPGTGNLISALGTGRTTCTTTHDAWLYVFLCPDSRFHYTNPNLDAQVLVESRPRNAEQKNLPAAKSAIEEFMRQIGELSEGVNRDQDIGSQGPEFPLAEIVSLKLHFDLDAELEFELQSAVDNWTRSKPDIFGRPESYAFFGKPQSNHVAMRPFCQRTLAGQPVRMPPFFSFFPTDEDAAYQLYADITCSEAHLYCKVDAY